MANTIVTVSQLCRFVKSLLEEQKQLGDLLVRGEVASISYRSSSGHLYFTLRDNDSSMRCVMFSRYADKLAHLPEEGSVVVVRCSVNLYERDGSISIVAYDLQELGTGTGQQSIDALKQKLSAEGLFAAARKRAFVPLPRSVAVVTSPDGAALQDIIATMRQHNPLVKLVIYPATVQGSGAARSVIAAIEQMRQEGICDSCIVARGGGSSDDLSAFNDEALVRAVAASPVPVVSAVGHEVDYSLTDLVADARAATPTAACRMVAVPATQLVDRVMAARSQLTGRIGTAIEQKQRRLERLTLMLSARSPHAELKKNRQTLAFLIKSLEEKELLIIERLRRRTMGAVDRLELVNPTQVLRRGYTITSSNGHVVSSVLGLGAGDRITTQLTDGQITSTVLSVEEEKC